MRSLMATAGLGAALVVGLMLFRAGAPVASGQERERSGEDDRVRPAPQTVPQRQWEYKVVVVCAPTMAEGPPLEDDLETALNEQGKRGWDLASVVSASDL